MECGDSSGTGRGDRILHGYNFARVPFAAAFPHFFVAPAERTTGP
jgi:hypothetical protein